MMFDNEDLILGGNMQLYMCNPPKRMTLSRKLEDITYTMYIDMFNTEIQAFNIQDGILSSDGKFFFSHLNQISCYLKTIGPQTLTATIFCCKMKLTSIMCVDVNLSLL